MIKHPEKCIWEVQVTKEYMQLFTLCHAYRTLATIDSCKTAYQNIISYRAKAEGKRHNLLMMLVISTLRSHLLYKSLMYSQDFSS